MHNHGFRTGIRRCIANGIFVFKAHQVSMEQEIVQCKNTFWYGYLLSKIALSITQLALTHTELYCGTAPNDFAAVNSFGISETYAVHSIRTAPFFY